jgi:hypothetical protein
MNENANIENNINNINNKIKIEHVCEPCNFKTLRYFDLERHYKSKLHERNGVAKTKKCDECDYVATTHWLIKKHKITNHSTIEERQKQKYYCNMCDLVFFCPLYKEKHLQSARHIKIAENYNLVPDPSV